MMNRAQDVWPIRLVGPRLNVGAHACWACGGFVPYPYRRLDPKLTTKVDGIELAFEVPADLAKDPPTEYGISILIGKETSGRIGIIRLKLRHEDEWLFLLEGESSWRGRFHELGRTAVLRELLKESGLAR